MFTWYLKTRTDHFVAFLVALNLYLNSAIARHSCDNVEKLSDAGYKVGHLVHQNHWCVIVTLRFESQ